MGCKHWQKQPSFRHISPLHSDYEERCLGARYCPSKDGLVLLPTKRPETLSKRRPMIRRGGRSGRKFGIPQEHTWLTNFSFL